MKKVAKYIIATLLIIFASNGLEAKTMRLKFQLRDSSGEPVVRARVVSDSGTSSVSDDKGFCEIQVDEKDILVITSTADTKISISVNDVMNNDLIVVIDTFSENVYLAFNSNVPKDRLVSSTQAKKGNEIASYPTLDITNSLTGQFTGLTVTENHAAGGMDYASTRAEISGRALKPVGWMINGMACSSGLYTSNQLDPQEIESITYVKDPVEKAKFGPNATMGLINVNLRKGYYGPLRVTVNTEAGLSTPDRFPEFCNGYDYAVLNNIARANSGYAPQYSDEQLAGFKANDPYSSKYPSVNYRDLLFNNYREFSKTNITLNGGNDIIRYNGYIGHAHDNELFKVGDNSDFHRFNLGTNLNARFSKYLTADVAAKASITSRRTPFVGSNTTSQYAIDNVMSELLAVTPVDFPVYAIPGEGSEETDFEANKIYAVSNRVSYNPFGDLAERGKRNDKGYDIFISAALNWDMSHWLKGLKSQTWFGSDIYFLTGVGQTRDYVAYIWEGADVPVTTISPSHKGAKASDYNNYVSKYYDSYSASQKFSYENQFGNHSLDATIVGQVQHTARVSKDTYERQMNLIGNVKYGYKDKYIFDVVGNYNGSMMFVKGNRFKFLPAAGFAWVASKEEFMKNSGFDHLKLYTQYGILAYESYDNPYIAMEEMTKGTANKFGPSANGSKWFGENSETPKYTKFNRYGNADLTYEFRKELTVGVEMEFLQNRLSVTANYFDFLRDGIIVDVTSVLPSTYGLEGVSYYDNYNKIHSYGSEFSIGWTDKAGDFLYSISANGIFNESVNLRYCENVTYDNVAITGTLVGDIFGYVYTGQYIDASDIASSPVNTLNIVKPGDLKYADVVEDGEINLNDRKVIGNKNPKLCYSINLFFKYKGIDLTIVGTGKAFMHTMLNTSYYWNGFGDGNISAFVRDNLNNSEVYPGLEYVRNTNNFQPSAYWLRKGDFFKIQNIELGYDFKFRNTSAIKGLRAYLRGANLLTLSGITDCDPEAMLSGVSKSPLYRTATLGLQLKF